VHSWPTGLPLPPFGSGGRRRLAIPAFTGGPDTRLILESPAHGSKDLVAPIARLGGADAAFGLKLLLLLFGKGHSA
jgi:hypothetical protein